MTFPSIEPLQVIWAIFSLAVIFSFAQLGLDQLRKHRPHIASMAFSYTLLVACFVVPNNPYDDWRRWVLVAALVLGVIGLVNYYRGTVKADD